MAHGLSDEEWMNLYGGGRGVVSTGSTQHGFTGGGYTSCYNSHKPLVLGATGLQIHGGSCSSPVIKDADIYIGFDGGMSFTRRHWPWVDGTEILFRIPDGRAPADPAAFRQLVDWTAEQLHAGKTVHCGCIGGHGRTGTFLAALVSVVVGEDDAITYVRENYCKKAVETLEQIEFLHKHYGIAQAGARKQSWGTTPSKPLSRKKAKKGAKGSTAIALDMPDTISPMRDTYSIWGPVEF
jgi:hypothetical protein